MSPIVDIRDLSVRFTGERDGERAQRRRHQRWQGEVLGLLGESGSGKSVTLRALLRMLPPRRTRIDRLDPTSPAQDVLALDEAALEDMRGGVVSMIFQEPMLALDPVYTIGDQIAETVVRHRGRELGGRPQARAGDAGGRAHPLGRAGGSTPIRTKCRAACGSGR